MASTTDPLTDHRLERGNRMDPQLSQRGRDPVVPDRVTRLRQVQFIFLKELLIHVLNQWVEIVQEGVEGPDHLHDET